MGAVIDRATFQTFGCETASRGERCDELIPADRRRALTYPAGPERAAGALASDEIHCAQWSRERSGSALARRRPLRPPRLQCARRYLTNSASFRETSEVVLHKKADYGTVDKWEGLCWKRLGRFSRRERSGNTLGPCPSEQRGKTANRFTRPPANLTSPRPCGPPGALKRGRGLRWILSYSPQWGCASNPSCPRPLLSATMPSIYQWFPNLLFSQAREHRTHSDRAMCRIPNTPRPATPSRFRPAHRLHHAKSLGGQLQAVARDGLARLSGANADALGL